MVSRDLSVYFPVYFWGADSADALLTYTPA